MQDTRLGSYAVDVRTLENVPALRSSWELDSMAASSRYNRQFLREMSGLIRSSPNHPLRFLLGSTGSLRTLARGFRNYYDHGDDVIFEGRTAGIRSPGPYRSIEIAAALGESVSVDACHVSTGAHSEIDILAVGIAEQNRADGSIERGKKILNEVVDIQGVPVIKAHALLWADVDLIDQRLVLNAPHSNGWRAKTQK